MKSSHAWAIAAGLAATWLIACQARTPAVGRTAAADSVTSTPPKNARSGTPSPSAGGSAPAAATSVAATSAAASAPAPPAAEPAPPPGEYHVRVVVQAEHSCSRSFQSSGTVVDVTLALDGAGRARLELQSMHRSMSGARDATTTTTELVEKSGDEWTGVARAEGSALSLDLPTRAHAAVRYLGPGTLPLPALAPTPGSARLRCALDAREVTRPGAGAPRPEPVLACEVRDGMPGVEDAWLSDGALVLSAEPGLVLRRSSVGFTEWSALEREGGP